MDEKRGANFRIWLCFAHIATVVAFPGLEDNKSLNLSCTNDFSEWICCHVDRQKCSGLNLTVQNDKWSNEKSCSLQQCGVGRCCCSVEMPLVLWEFHTATVWREGRRMESTTFNVKNSMKPKTPTIVSVKESNGDIEILWDPKMKGIANRSLQIAEVTYYKVSDMKMERKTEKPPTVSGFFYAKIPGRNLEPSTTYRVSVRSITSWSGKISESSNTTEFKTSASSNSTLLAVIISLSVGAIFLSILLYICFDKMKSNWWDIVTKYPNPELDIKHSNEQEVLKPISPIISPISVDPILPDDSKQWSTSSGGSLEHSSGFSTGSSDLSYANTNPVNIIASVQDALSKILPNISPMSKLMSSLEEKKNISDLLSSSSDPRGSPANDMSNGSSGLMNRTYSIIIPRQNEENSPKVPMQTEMLCESMHCSNETGMLDNHPQQVPVVPVPAHQEFCFPSGISSSVEIDMSYQPCNSESGAFSEGSTFSSFSSDIKMIMSSDLESRDETGCGIVDEVISSATKLKSSDEGPVVTDTSASNRSESAESQSELLMSDDYQPFQNLVGQHNVFL
ncbi:unnamed protein product [Ophioblennius macclurei]